MSNREYEGPPRDYSWQDIKDRPYKGKGDTVDVIDDTESGSSTVEGSPQMAVFTEYYQSNTYHLLDDENDQSVCGQLDLEETSFKCRKMYIYEVPDERDFCRLCEEGLPKAHYLTRIRSIIDSGEDHSYFTKTELRAILRRLED